MADFTMPSLGADMDEGTLLEWCVRPGDVVHRGDVMAVIDTSKSAVEVECFHDGVVGRLLVEPGTRVPVGAVLATIQEAATPDAVDTGAVRVASPLVRQDARRLGVDVADVAGTGPRGAVTRGDVAKTRRAPDAAGPVPTGEAGARTPARVRATPYARRLAREAGIPLESIVAADGSTVRADDVAAATSARRPAEVTGQPAPPAGTHAPHDMRASIAAMMARSKREVPHYYLAHTVDLSAALAWMEQRNRSLPVEQRLLPAALVLHATARAVAATPALNGFWVDGAHTPGDGVHVGVAVSLRGGGLLAPAILDADRLTVEETMARLKDLVLRARAGRLRRRELAEPTITVTNLGEQGVETVYGVIHAPQVALVGVGRIVERPWAVAGMVGVRPLITMTLSADHRATDGFVGARFLALVEDHLQHPEET